MCDSGNPARNERNGIKTIQVAEAVGMVLAHDITEIRKDEFKGCAFRKGHVVRAEDVEHLRRLGKERLFALSIADDEMHEDDAACALANSLAGDGVCLGGEPKEGKINLLAARDGLLKVDRQSLLSFNMLGDVMCATLHTNTVVQKGRVVGGTRAIPLVVKKTVVHEAVRIAEDSRKSGPGGVIEVKELRRPKVGMVITGNEVYHGRIQDAFAPIIMKKIEAFHGEIVGTYFAPDDAAFIRARLRELIEAGADILITTGGMSVDPDDVTRFAIRSLGVSEMYYGSAMLPGAMFLVGYLAQGPQGQAAMGPGGIPILGVPACGMYHKITVFDLIFPRVLAGEHIGRRELAEMGHGGLCMNCSECRWPVCPFGK